LAMLNLELGNQSIQFTAALRRHRPSYRSSPIVRPF